MPTSTPTTSDLRTAEDLPTTSQPSIGDFLAVYEPLLAEGRDIVSVHLAGGISGTVRVGRAGQAARSRSEGKGGERIVVMDSRHRVRRRGARRAGRGRGVAARGARASTPCARVQARRREHLKMWFAIDTLEYLRRGGRIGAAQAWLGAALKIKPILTVESRDHADRARAHVAAARSSAWSSTCASATSDGADGWVVQHIQAPDEAGRARRARARDLRHRARCSSPRSARSSAPTSARACSACGGLPQR